MVVVVLGVPSPNTSWTDRPFMEAIREHIDRGGIG